MKPRRLQSATMRSMRSVGESAVDMEGESYRDAGRRVNRGVRAPRPHYQRRACGEFGGP
jgi:hypothetical protein